MIKAIVKIKSLISNPDLLPELLDIEYNNPTRTSNLPALGCDVYHAEDVIAQVAGMSWIDNNTFEVFFDPCLEVELVKELIDINGCSFPGEGQRISRNNILKHSSIQRDVAEVVEVTFG